MSYSHYNNSKRRNKLAEPAQLLSGVNLWSSTADQKHMLGMIFETNQGDEYRYCKNGATALIKAGLIQAEAFDAQQVGRTQAGYGASVGDVTFSILCTTANGIVDGDLVNGHLLINLTGAAMGDLYVINNNRWLTGDTVMEVTIADAGGVRTAIAVGDYVTFLKNQFRDVIIKPTTLTAPILGVTTSIIPKNYYFWAKTKGVTSVLTDGDGAAIVVGEPVGHTDAIGNDGEIQRWVAVATDTPLGTCLYPSSDNEACLVNLSIFGI